MNVNDLICVGARPVSLVDYIAVEKADAAMLDGIAAGLAEGARQSNISITGGEIAQLRDVVRGFDLVGTAIGTVPLDRIIVGRDLVPGEWSSASPAAASTATAMTLARRVLFDRRGLTVDSLSPNSAAPLGEELLRPTFIYVPEILEVLEQIPSVKALVHITGDGLLNLPRVAAEVGFVLDDLPPPPPIFGLIEEHRRHPPGRDVRGLQYGDRLLRRAGRSGCAAALAILRRHGGEASRDRPCRRRPEPLGRLAARQAGRARQAVRAGMSAADRPAR